MGRHFSHLATAVKILGRYDGSMPFSIFIKSFFSSEKKYGSSDRRQVSSLCYAFFRSGHLLKKSDIAEKIITSVFLTEQQHNDFLSELRPEWNLQVASSTEDKLRFLQKVAGDIFPFIKELTAGIDHALFLQSFFVQPLLFARIRPGGTKTVIQKINAAGISYKMLEPDCLAMPNGTRIQDVLKINDEVVVQDLNSQKVLDYLKTNPVKLNEMPGAWDCCAASGGKSILLYDALEGKVRLTVSDIRETILSTLHTRLHKAGIRPEQSYLKDLTQSGLQEGEVFDIIICDAPCTGSGTWSRTPEHMFYFNRNKIDSYCQMQQKIICNSIISLNKGSLFFYITCSVFSRENEQQVDFILANFKVRKVHMAYLKGYENQADTMFVAVFQKPL